MQNLWYSALRSTINTEFVSQVSWRKIRIVSGFIVLINYAARCHADFKNSDITLEFSDITLTFWKIIAQYMIL